MADSWRSGPSVPLALPHPNLFLKPVPFGMSEANLREHFQPYGNLCSVRICRSSPATGVSSDDHAFVRFMDVASAQRVLMDPNASIIFGQHILIKLADADVVPKLKSGLSESEWIYCRGLPPNIRADDIVALFSRFGRVVDMKYFASTASYKGTGALLRFGCVEHAKMAINTMHDQTLDGSAQPLLVRFADSPAEKAAKMTRKDLLAKNGRVQPLQAMLLASQGSGPSQMHRDGSADSVLLMSPSLSVETDVFPSSPERKTLRKVNETARPQEHVHVFEPSNPKSSVITIAGMPQHADKLWVYENFAIFGAITAVVMSNNLHEACGIAGCGMSTPASASGHILDGGNTIPVGPIDATVQYTNSQSAVNARDAMNGRAMGGKALRVALKNCQGPPAQRVSLAPPTHGPRIGGMSLPNNNNNNSSNNSWKPLVDPLFNVKSPYSSGFSEDMLSNLMAMGRVGDLPSQLSGRNDIP
jgi:RNA recognition motif-containing protein